MKTKVNIYTEDWCNLVFEGKNKEYGAFAIRTHAPNEKVKSILISVFFAISIATIPLIRSHNPNPIPDKLNDDPTKISKITIEPLHPIEPLTPPSFKPMRPTLKFNNPVVGTNIEPEDIPTNEQMFNSKFGIGKMNITDENPNYKGEFDDEITGGTRKQKIFDICEKMPQFKGGMDELRRFLIKNLTYPDMAKSSRISGKVYVQFVVDKSGEIKDIKVLRGLDKSCDEEAIRVVNLMPQWNPGMQNGTPVSVYFTLPITFTLGQD